MYTYRELLTDLQKLNETQLDQQVKVDPGHGWDEREVTKLDAYTAQGVPYPVTLELD